MPRKFVFPDPNDRSHNNPSVIVTSARVLAAYRKSTGEPMEKVTKKVQDEFIRVAIEEYGWDKATFSGNQCILEADIAPKRGKKSQEE